MVDMKSLPEQDRPPSEAQRIAYHIAGAVLGVLLGVATGLLGVAMGFGGASYWVAVPSFVALGIGFGFMGPAMLVGGIAGATVGLSGALPTLALLIVGGLIGMPLGLVPRRRMWGWFQRGGRRRR